MARVALSDISGLLNSPSASEVSFSSSASDLSSNASAAGPSHRSLFGLPLSLPRPDYIEQVNPDDLELDEELKGVPIAYILDELKTCGAQLLAHSSKIICTHLPSATRLPAQLLVRVPEEVTLCPTHVFSVRSGSEMMLLPVHGLPYALATPHLSQLSRYHASTVDCKGLLPLPVIALRVPHLESFGLLHAWIMHPSVPALLNHLLPIDTSKLCIQSLRQSAHQLDTQRLLRSAQVVYGLWQNTVALEIGDSQLWIVIAMAWEVVTNEKLQRHAPAANLITDGEKAVRGCMNPKHETQLLGDKVAHGPQRLWKEFHALHHVASDTRQLGATIDVETTKLRFLGNLRLDVWDCAGQASYFDEFLANRQDALFRQVHSMIYIFDVESPAFHTSDADYFSRCLVALKNASTKQPSHPEEEGPFVHVLIHKMDLVNAATRDQVLETKSQEIRRRCQEAGWSSVKIFGTSIWNETLYRAWSVIVSTFIPNSVSLKNQLDTFAQMCSADEVVLFETTTFLVISRSTNEAAEKQLGWEEDRFEKICQCIKMFRLSCSYLLRMNFSSMEMKHRSYSAVLSGLTSSARDPTPDIMVISTNPAVQTAGIALNIKLAAKHFSALEAVRS